MSEAITCPLKSPGKLPSEGGQEQFAAIVVLVKSQRLPSPCQMFLINIAMGMPKGRHIHYPG